MVVPKLRTYIYMRQWTRKHRLGLFVLYPDVFLQARLYPLLSVGFMFHRLISIISRWPARRPQEAVPEQPNLLLSGITSPTRWDMGTGPCRMSSLTLRGWSSVMDV